MLAPATASLWFLVLTAPICLFVAWSDMARMKIPNQAVLATVLVFAVVGPFVLPLPDYGWRWLHLAIVLTMGFVMNMVGLLGAGDAKFAAAMAPFVAAADIFNLMVLFAAIMLAAFVTHRLARAIPPIRAMVPHWESWRRKDFPMGLALAGTLSAYLAFAATFGV